METTNGYGWPTVPSDRGELQPACPQCGSRRIRYIGQPMTSEYLINRYEIIRCKDCGHSARRPVGSL